MRVPSVSPSSSASSCGQLSPSAAAVGSEIMTPPTGALASSFPSTSHARLRVPRSETCWGGGARR
eukprot:183319-Rhodomonas_salina.1